MTNILQSDLLVNFLYPLLFVFVLIFAILEKTKIFGEKATQSNAVLALVIGLIFVGFVVPKTMVVNLIYFLSVGLFVIFVILILWGFISGNNSLSVTDGSGTKIHKFFAVLVFGSIILAVIWVSGVGDELINFLNNLVNLIFNAGNSVFWTNFILVAIVLVIIFGMTGFNPFSSKVNPWIKLN